MRHATRSTLPLPRFNRLYLESLEDRLLLSGFTPAAIPSLLVLPESGEATVLGLVPADSQPPMDEQPVFGPAAPMQRSGNGAPERPVDQYFAAGASGELTAEPRTFSSDSTPDDDFVYTTQVGANEVQLTPYQTDVTGGQRSETAEYPSETGADQTDPQRGERVPSYGDEHPDGMAAPYEGYKDETTEEGYEDESTEEYVQYPPSAASVVQPMVNQAPATEQVPASHTSIVVDPTPPSSQPSQPGAPTIAVKQGSAEDTAAPIPRESDSADKEATDPDQSLAVPEPEELESLADEVIEEPGDTPPSLAAEEPIQPVLQPASLLAGASPIDLATLKRAANEVLARLEALGKDLAASPKGWSRSQWLVVAILAAGTLELARRRIRRPSESAPPEGWDELTSHLFPVLAIPPEGEL